jgi:hypothetical protein
VAAARSLVIHVLTRPVDKNEPIPHDDPNSLTKLAAQGLPEEDKIILGILHDTYSLLALLPKHKHKAWLQELRQILEKGQVTFKELKKLVGRLENVCMILQPGRHFIGRIWALLATYGFKDRYTSQMRSKKTSSYGSAS